MKKLLALVMALVMVMGLATVGTSAAYADQDDINYEEAVDVMSAIGVLAGDETGFRPADTLKRSEGAKIVAYLMLGNKAAESMTASGTKYTDLPANHWAAGYMEYLSSIGVMGGIGGGKIDPDGALTTTAFAKMLLTALGYDAEIEGFGGSDWAINVQKVAQSVDLFSGNNAVTPSATITREEAALYAFNTLRTPLVEYDSKVSVNVQGAAVTIANNSAKGVSSTNAAKQTISFDETPDSTAGTPVYYVEFAEKYYPDLKNATLVAGVGDRGIDDLGRPVRTWTMSSAKVGTYVAKDGLVKTWEGKVTPKMVYELLGKSIRDSLLRGTFTAAGAFADIGTYLVAYEDGANVDMTQTGVIDTKGTVGYAHNSSTVPVGATDAAAAALAAGAASARIDSAALARYMQSDNTYAVNSSDNGSVTELYMDEDLNIDIVTYHTYLYQAAADYNTSLKTLDIVAGNDSSAALALDSYRLKLEDFPEIEEIKADDYLLVTLAETAADVYEVQTIAKAETLTGTVNEFNRTAGQNVTIDGTKYSYSKMITDDEKNDRFTVGEKTTVVLDAQGYIIKVDEAVVNSNYVFVERWGSSSGMGGDARAKVVFSDGTTGEISVKSAWSYAGAATVTAKATIAGWGTTTNANMWYTYSKDSSNNYALYNIEAKNAQKVQTYTNTGTAISQEVSYNDKAVFLRGVGQLANEKTVMIVKDAAGDVNTYTGIKNLPIITLPTLGDTANAYIVYSGSYASLVYVTTDGNIVGGANEELVYVTVYKTERTTSDNETYYVYTTLDGTNETEVQADNVLVDNTAGVTYNPGNKNVYAPAWYTQTNSKGQLTGFRLATTNQSGSIHGGTGDSNISYDNGIISVGGEGFSVTDNTKITVVTRQGSNMNADANKAYVATVYTGKAGANNAANVLKNWAYTYNYGAKTTSTDGMTLSELYVTIITGQRAATATVKGGAANATADTTAINTALNGAAGVANVTVPKTTNPVYIDATVLTTVGANKTLTFEGDVVIVKNAGTLAINGGTVIVKGNLTNGASTAAATPVIALSAGGSLTVNGTITDWGKVTVNGATLVVNGTAGSTINSNSIEVTGGGVLSIAGPVDLVGTISVTNSTANLGTVTLSGAGSTLTLTGSSTEAEIDKIEVAHSSATVTVSVGATVDVEEFAFEADNTNVTLTGANVTIGTVTAEDNVTSATITADTGTKIASMDAETEGVVDTTNATSTAFDDTVVVTVASAPTFAGGTEAKNVTVTTSDYSVALQSGDEDDFVIVDVTVQDAKTAVGATLDTGDARTYYVAGDTALIDIVIGSDTIALPSTMGSYSVTGLTGINSVEAYDSKDYEYAVTVTAKWTVE